jgi:hypothetical protein
LIAIYCAGSNPELECIQTRQEKGAYPWHKNSLRMILVGGVRKIVKVPVKLTHR